MTVQAVEVFTPYTTATATYSALPTWMDEYEAQRINAYQVYEQIYWNVPDTFKLVQRGEDASPIYLPTGRTIVDTTNRFLCPKPGFIIDPDIGTPDEQEQCRRFISLLLRRERFWSKFQSNKRYGVMRGDWVWHILANPKKEPGKRIKIEAIDPAAYFPVYHPDDPDRLIAVYLVEQFTDGDDTYIKRQTYTKGAEPVENDGSDTRIFNSVALYKTDAWEALDDKAVKILKPVEALHPAIKAIPLYHIPNIETPGDPYGSSELRGFERIMAAANQAISDEELILALDGLGMYATDGGPPRDISGNEVDWNLGPGMVVEHTLGSEFKRVTGVTTVSPMQDHIKMLVNSLKEASATSDAAMGKVDVMVAESGIALIMQLHPMLAKVEEREETVTDVHTQMFHDLTQMWMPAYEGFVTPCAPLPLWGSPLPENRDKEIERILKFVELGLADADWARTRLGELGYDFPTTTGAAVLKEKTAWARATDPFASRLDNEEEVQQ
jgi:hypothetical protein